MCLIRRRPIQRRPAAKRGLEPPHVPQNPAESQKSREIPQNPAKSREIPHIPHVPQSQAGKPTQTPRSAGGAGARGGAGSGGGALEHEVAGEVGSDSDAIGDARVCHQQHVLSRPVGKFVGTFAPSLGMLSRDPPRAAPRASPDPALGLVVCGSGGERPFTRKTNLTTRSSGGQDVLPGCRLWDGAYDVYIEGV